MGFSRYLSENSKKFAPLSGIFQGIGQIGGRLMTHDSCENVLQNNILAKKFPQVALSPCMLIRS